ncbi:hypothetical protein LCGC14_3118110 [marine sediment metagenome]|uniref:Uncharacterized protein n=1 Tax=marine sediment metagenome TaxID=412755 RepID=A0A0F8YAJ1_9ZZZZ
MSKSLDVIILEGPQGKRSVASGVAYRLLPGEKIVGIESRGPVDEGNSKLRELAKQQGMGVGDLVAKLTKVFGIKPCSGCEQRRQVLNKLRKLLVRILLSISEMMVESTQHLTRMEPIVVGLAVQTQIYRISRRRVMKVKF